MNRLVAIRACVAALFQSTPAATVILEEMINELRDLRRSNRHINALHGDLAGFIALNPHIEQWKAQQITEYLRGLEVGPRRRDNVRDALVQLSRFARRQNYLPEDRRSEAEKIRKIKPGHDVVTWTPAEAQLLLEHADPRWIPAETIEQDQRDQTDCAAKNNSSNRMPFENCVSEARGEKREEQQLAKRFGIHGRIS